jgi:esterase/lipase
MAIRGPGGTPLAWDELRLLASVAAIGLVMGGMALRAADTAEPPAASFVSTPACQDADRASLAQLVQLLERNRSTDAPVLERAVHALNVARRHCLYGWNDLASQQYDWLDHWLAEHR